VKWLNSHPAPHVQRFLLDQDSEAMVHLSTYVYFQGRIDDPRRPLKFPARALRVFAAQMDRQCGKTRDLALHSTFQNKPGADCRHMVLVDLASDASDARVLRIARNLKERWAMKILLVESGRAAHLYGLGGLNTREWLQEMVSLLKASDSSGPATLIRPPDVASFLEGVLARPELSLLDTQRIAREFLADTVAPLFPSRSLVTRSAAWSTAVLDENLAAPLEAAAFALLQNPPLEAEVVDTRWVAHRLLAGYGTLRWTANQPRYLKEPRVVNEF
jgi:hypothetical protein